MPAAALSVAIRIRQHHSANRVVEERPGVHQDPRAADRSTAAPHPTNPELVRFPFQQTYQFNKMGKVAAARLQHQQERQLLLPLGR